MQVIKDGNSFTILPKTHKRTLIWLHGFSCTGDFHLEDLLTTPILPDCKVVLPTADLHPIPSMQNELYHAWYTRLTFRYHDSIEPSVSRIVALIETESKNTEELFIGGFSQGGVLASLCGLSRSSRRIKAVLSFGGYAFPMNILEERKRIPMLVYHGVNDLIVPWERARKSYEMNLAGVEYEVKVNQNCAHEIPREGFLFAREWLASKFVFGN